MGVVYEARQVSLNRPVALKMVKAGLLAGDDELRRFRNEAEAVALLDHPGVVPVYEVGEHQGQHYFSMKLVGGGSLAPLIDRYIADPRAAAGLLAEAAEAVAHAHARGILHRDLKPANILIDDRGRPHVTDFGLAKRVEGDVDLTQSGAIMGTPAYMSPEQATGRRGGITVATDVYGLGAVLYALLAGQAPFGGDSVVETLDAVRHRTPEPPTRLNARVPRDLETICLKCLEKDPRRRYATAQAMADDLRAWLESRPIAARRVGAAERVWLWCRRKPALATMAAAVAVAVVGGAAATIAVQANANRALRDKNDELTAAYAREADANAGLAAANTRVEQRYGLAVEAIKTFHTGVSEDFLLKEDRFKALRDRLLRSAADFYAKLGALVGRETDIGSRRALAAANHELAELTAKVGRIEDALGAHRSVLTAREAMAAEPGADATARADVGRSLTAVAGLLEATGKSDEALAAYRRAESLLADPSASDPRARSARAACRSRMGGLLSATGKPDEALIAYREARADQEALAASAGDTTDARNDLAETVYRIGNLLQDTGKLAEAEAEHRAAIAIRRGLAGARPAVADFRRRLADSHLRLGTLLKDTGRTSEAEAEYRAALAIHRELTETNPAVTDFRERLARGHVSLGVLLFHTSKLAESEAEFRAAMTISRDLARENPAVTLFRNRLAEIHNNLGNIHYTRGNPAGAEAEYREALAIHRKLADENPSVTLFRSRLAMSHYNLGVLLPQTGKAAEATAEFRAAMAIGQKLADDNPTVTEFRGSVADAHIGLGWLLSQTGEPAGAEAEYRAALAIYRGLAEANPAATEIRSQLALSHTSLGEWLRDSGKRAEAEAEYRAALAIYRGLAEANPAVTEFRRVLAECRAGLGWLLSRAGKVAEAESEYRAALAIERKLAEDNPEVPAYRDAAANCESNLAVELRRLRRAAEAREHADRAVALREVLVDEHPETSGYRIGLSVTLLNRALVRRDTGDPDGAAADLRRALGLLDAMPSRTGEQWFLTAGCHAALAGLAGPGTSAAAAAREAAEAMSLLYRAVALDYRSPDAYRDEDALDALRTRPDFRLLMWDLAMPADPFARGD
jgi:tetratricopeptide (TPR) repeat protein